MALRSVSLIAIILLLVSPLQGKGLLSLGRRAKENKGSKESNDSSEDISLKKKRANGAIELAKRIRIRQQRFSRVRNQQGLAALLFPGVAPEQFALDEDIPMWIDWVNSESGQIPFNYYDLPVCPGPSVGKMKRLRKNLGAKLQGHNLTPSPFSITALRDLPCTPLCMVQVMPMGVRKLRRMIARKYRVHANLDSLPVVMATPKESESSDDEQDEEDDERSLHEGGAVRGYPLGFTLTPEAQDEEEEKTKKTILKKNVEPEFYYFNHVKFLIRYSEDPQEFEGIRIVGFEAETVSIRHELEDPKTSPTSINSKTPLKTCSARVSPQNTLSTLLPLRMNSEIQGPGDMKFPSFDVIYSYEVKWIRSNLSWADRWDRYMGSTNPDDRVHYFSILNSLLVVFALSGVVAFFLVRTLRKDISYYNENFLDGAVGDDEGEGGWKLLHGDVFRTPPAFVHYLCVAVGTGVQITVVLFLTILTAVSGILPPMGKGQLLTAVLVLYVLSGSVAGYVSARLFKYFDLNGWKVNTLMTATAFPGLIMSLFLLLDICLAWAGASSAVSIWVILLLFVLWVCVASPLVLVGSYFGYRQGKIENPTKTKQIARVIPPERQSWFTKAPYCIIAGGVLPFASVMLEVYFIMEAVWLHQLYYVMTFLFGVFLILVTICAEMSISLCYLQLNAEDHQWHWKSFLNSASFGGYLMVYSVWFSVSKLALIGFMPTIVYFTYMSMVALALGLFCGSVGFLSSFWFVRTIYGAVKVD